MKQMYKYLLVSFVLLFALSCEDMEKMNIDPDYPAEVPSNMVFSGAQKKAMDYVYDNWFSGRQCLVYSQYWAQRNYTEEDRYQIRESVNNNYFNHFYTILASFDDVIRLNTDPEKAVVSSAYGANANQIAASMIMKVWLYSVMTDTWGDIPYSEAGKLKEGIYYPKYDDQKEIYAALIGQLTEAAAMIDESDVAFTGGDMVYGGDASAWKKFANSLKCRLALHTSKVDATWKTHIAQALADGVFTSNADVAAYHYSSTAPEYSYFYSGYYIEARNDFTITRTLVDILKGQRDTLNNKTHPWEGALDPRLTVYTTPGPDNTYVGMPYGVPTASSSRFRGGAPNWYANPPLHLNPDYPVPLMTYAEILFIRSEYNGFSAAEYEAGVKASVDYWTTLAGEPSDAADYLEAVKQAGANAETVALQKYIDFFNNGTEAWTEIRRTGYPDQLIRPGEITVAGSETVNGVDIRFEPLSDTKGMIIARVKYPTNESTLNGNNFNEAVARLDDGTNNYYTHMFWDVRSTGDPHPANK
ncbi:MAG: SusD/RagB family nutrient-binding outer membrane lipoprotein [Tannerellaceae bacterium]|jgi:hypothetical protein|nr:SusD/RagB family nutrient-binding outer membrane lipoprotein [Tannerellaceae bacterium]